MTWSLSLIIFGRGLVEAEESVRFGGEHGLPANQTTTIAAAPDGRIWVGTLGGAARFDGTEWQRFDMEGEPGAVAVNDLLVQRDGRRHRPGCLGQRPGQGL